MSCNNDLLCSAKRQHYLCSLLRITWSDQIYMFGVCVCVCVKCNEMWLTLSKCHFDSYNSIHINKLCLPCWYWILDILPTVTLKINSPLFLVVYPLCRWSWAGSRKWWFMTRAPKRRGICPKTASCTFSWESWRAPSTKSPCSLVCKSVWSMSVICCFLFFPLSETHFSVFLYLLPRSYCKDGRCALFECSYLSFHSLVSRCHWLAQQMLSHIILVVRHFLTCSDQTFTGIYGHREEKRKYRCMLLG